MTVPGISSGFLDISMVIELCNIGTLFAFVIVAASVLTNLTCYLRPAIVALGRLEISLWTNLLTAATLAGSAWLLAPRTQHVGVAQAWFLAHVVGVGSGILLMERSVRVRED